LNGSPFIQPLPEQNTDLERLLHTHHLSPDIRFTTSDNYTAYSMVAAGLGISLNNALMTNRVGG
jgi:DNA-binding transcriptional LysR family regulator